MRTVNAIRLLERYTTVFTDGVGAFDALVNDVAISFRDNDGQVEDVRVGVFKEEDDRGRRVRTVTLALRLALRSQRLVERPGALQGDLEVGITHAGPGLRPTATFRVRLMVGRLGSSTLLYREATCVTESAEALAVAESFIRRRLLPRLVLDWLEDQGDEVGLTVAHARR